MSSPSTRHIRAQLEAARALVASGWCQHGPAARGPGSMLVDVTDPTARAWSPVGALMRVTSERGAWDGGATPIACLRALRDALPKPPAPTPKVTNGAAPKAKAAPPAPPSSQVAICILIADWNDAESRSQADVVALFTAAIDRLRQEEAA